MVHAPGPVFSPCLFPLPFPLLSVPSSFSVAPFFRPSLLIVMTPKVQCHGCSRWFSPRSLSQHISKSLEMHCQDTSHGSHVRRASSSTQLSATRLLLSPNHASLVSRGRPPDHEYDHTMGGQLSDGEIAITRGVIYFFPSIPFGV